jgi:hypothetical protein
MHATDIASPGLVTAVNTGPSSSHSDGAVPSDEDLVNDVRAGRLASFEVLMRRYNQRLFRVAKAVVATTTKPRTWPSRPTSTPTSTSISSSRERGSRRG